MFAINDATAIGAIKALINNDIEVPKQYVVMGFNGIEIGEYGEYIDPSLSTVKGPITKSGETASKILVKAILGEKIKKKQRIFSEEEDKRNF